MTSPPSSTGRGFVLDRFQVEAIEAIDGGRSVLVAAPTGSGKTVVAEHAVEVAIAAGRRAFYTTPIKALSNQKYLDLVRRHGAASVGLLTGDNAINGEAPVVVMTTEVLRNMLYAGSDAVGALAWVVLDEVHYLQDAYRGPVWEEVLIHTPAHVGFVCLSATVSNADELASWIASIRGPVATVVEHRRPVELINHFLVEDRLDHELALVPTLVKGRANPDGQRFDAPDLRGPRQGRQRGRPRRRWATPRRAEVVDRLREDRLLPAIYFIFSRAGCDDAARTVLEQGVRMTTPDDRARIREIAERRTDHLSDADLDVLDYDAWLAGLEAGVAAHHAGMVPPFKEAVEACFVEGLVKVVFATETLALGINMPARSVVIESLSKFTGERHEDLSPSQYTQLTGRAGRRGLDPVGHAIVLWSPWYGFDKVAALASSRDFVLRSAFTPTYNMAANLVRRYDRRQAHRLLDQSFAQFQTDRANRRLVARRDKVAAALADAEAEVSCELGDIDEYRELVRIDQAVAEAARPPRQDVEDAMSRLAPGDVIRDDGERLAVLTVAYRKGAPRLRVVDSAGRVRTIDPDDLDEAPERAAALSLPEPFNPHDRAFVHQTVELLRKARLRQRRHVDDEPPSAGETMVGARARDHPVAGCPDLESHLRHAADADRLRRDLGDLDSRIRRQSDRLGRRFDAIVDLLTDWGYLDGWHLAARGDVLVRLYHESDLLVAEALCEGLLDDLEPAALAGVVSTLTYEHRSKEAPPTPWYPSKDVRARAVTIERIARRLQGDEAKAGLPLTRLPDPTFLPLAHAWAAGEDLDVVLDDEDLSGGDFVRNVKQLIDLLRQVADVAPDPGTRAAAGAAADALLRGIVSAASAVGEGVDDDEPWDEPEAEAPDPRDRRDGDGG